MINREPETSIYETFTRKKMEDSRLISSGGGFLKENSGGFLSTLPELKNISNNSFIKSSKNDPSARIHPVNNHDY